MATRYSTPLPWRGVVSVSGPDSRSLLQGLVTQDVALADGRQVCWGAFLTPQGRFLHDLFILQSLDGEPDSLLLETDGAHRDDLVQRLTRYRLRARCEITSLADTWRVHALWGSGAAAALAVGDTPGAATAAFGGVLWRDPRHPSLGLRALLPANFDPTDLVEAGFDRVESSVWDQQRIALGVPDGHRDLLAERSLPMETGFDGLNGLSWTKGCYVGQELTARMHYRALVKRRLVPVRIDGPMPQPGTSVTAGGTEIGDVRSVVASGPDTPALALAYVKLDALHDALTGRQSLQAGDARLVPAPPDWLRPLVQGAAVESS
jgi:folate-binding protein YgfZ